MVTPVSAGPKKGRGAVSNASGRFEGYTRHDVDDGWALMGDDAPPGLRTVVGSETCRTIISSNTSPDIAFDRSINPYRGCEHGCVYCFARPTHAYMGLSPGLDFETRIFAKDNADQVLKAELRKPGYRCRVIAIGANTDPYQPSERERQITRRLLRVLSAHNHPVSITTKSDLILRDLDILGSMAERGLASAAVSVTTLDRDLARKLEPRAPTPAKRVRAIAGLAEAGVPVAVLAAPMIPFLNDAELERILGSGREAGAGSAAYILLRLPLELKELFAEWLEAHAPGKASHVLNQLRESRGGMLYVADFETRRRGTGAYADLLAKRFRLACRKLGFTGDRDVAFDLDTAQFRPPPRVGDQLALL